MCFASLPEEDRYIRSKIRISQLPQSALTLGRPLYHYWYKLILVIVLTRKHIYLKGRYGLIEKYMGKQIQMHTKSKHGYLHQENSIWDGYNIKMHVTVKRVNLNKIGTLRFNTCYCIWKSTSCCAYLHYVIVVYYLT